LYRFLLSRVKRFFSDEVDLTNPKSSDKMVYRVQKNTLISGYERGWCGGAGNEMIRWHGFRKNKQIRKGDIK